MILFYPTLFLAENHVYLKVYGALDASLQSPQSGRKLVKGVEWVSR